MKVKVPENINEITLGQVQDYVKLEEVTDYDITRIFFGLSKQKTNQLKKSDADFLVERIKELLDQEVTELTPRFKLNGKEFGFIPDLDDMTKGEHADLLKYINDFQQMHRAMAVLYRPITLSQYGKYDIEEYKGTKKYANTMKQMPFGVMVSSKVFFWNLTTDLLNSIPRFIEEESQIALAESGELTRLSTSLQAVMCSDSMKQLGLTYTLL